MISIHIYVSQPGKEDPVELDSSPTRLPGLESSRIIVMIVMIMMIMIMVIITINNNDNDDNTPSLHHKIPVFSDPDPGRS